MTNSGSCAAFLCGMASSRHCKLNGPAGAQNILRNLRFIVGGGHAKRLLPACLLATALDSPEVPASGSRIEDYELLNEIARGGMGIVYRAQQRTPSRIVALKMILPVHLRSSGAVNRFRTEAEAAASSITNAFCRSTQWANRMARRSTA